MTEIKIILENVLERYLERLDSRIEYESKGICSAAWDIYGLFSEKASTFEDYLRSNTKDIKVFYCIVTGIEVTDKYKREGSYLWKEGDYRSRIDWLEKHIKLNS
jgi:hypothetical protein